MKRKRKFTDGLVDKGGYHGIKLQRLIAAGFIRPIVHDIEFVYATEKPKHADMVIAAIAYTEKSFGWKFGEINARYGPTAKDGQYSGGYFTSDAQCRSPRAVIECGGTDGEKIEFSIKHGISVLWFPYPHHRAARVGVLPAYLFTPMDGVCWAWLPTGVVCGEQACLRVRNQHKFVNDTNDRLVLCDKHTDELESGSNPERRIVSTEKEITVSFAYSAAEYAQITASRPETHSLLERARNYAKFGDLPSRSSVSSAAIISELIVEVERLRDENVMLKAPK